MESTQRRAAARFLVTLVAVTGCSEMGSEPPPPVPARETVSHSLMPSAEQLPTYDEVEPYLESASLTAKAEARFESGTLLAIGQYESWLNNVHELGLKAVLLKNGSTIAETPRSVTQGYSYPFGLPKRMIDTVTLTPPQPCLLEGRADVDATALIWYAVPTAAGAVIIGTTPPHKVTAASPLAAQPGCPQLEFDQKDDPVVLYYGQQKALSANCYGEPPQWMSSNVNIASVSGGVVTGTSNDFGLWTPPATAVITVTCRGESAHKNVLVRQYDPDPTYEYGDIDCNPSDNEDPADDCPEDYEPPCTECQQWLNWECTYTPISGFRCSTWEEWDCYTVDANLCQEPLDEDAIAFDKPRAYDTLAIAALSRSAMEVT